MGNGKKMTLIPLILMIFTSVFGFNNMPRAFYLMGYGAIPWYILSGLTFFLPYAFMIAEYGASFKNESGGIYTWMEKSIGSQYAFIATFMWYASYVVWMVMICSTILINISNIIFGSDKTSQLRLFSLNSTQVIGLIAIVMIILITFAASKGLSWVSKVASIGGTSVLAINVLFLVGALVVLIANGGKLAQPITSAGSFFTSPNPSYLSPIAVLSFIVFAIFAYGGTEVVGGVVDQTENAEKTFPKGMLIAAVIITIGYSLGIFLCGIFTKWSGVLSANSVNMANAQYVIMNNFGYQIGKSLGASQSLAIQLGNWSARIVSLSVFLSLMGAFFTLSYAPLKQLIEGTPAKLWPGKLAKIDNGIPKFAMWIQCLIVVIMLFLISFGGSAAKVFFARVVLMTNVAMTLPYLFLCLAYPAFKSKENIKKPFEIFKSKSSILIATILTAATVGFANVFTIIQPAFSGDISSTIWMIAGPLFFTIVAILLYKRYEAISKSEILTKSSDVKLK